LLSREVTWVRGARRGPAGWLGSLRATGVRGTRSGRGVRWLASVAVLAALLHAGSEARAWENVRQVVHGSARVLDKGETVIGVLSPVGYGLHERLTLFAHPALYLLLSPNAWLRLAVLNEELGLSAEAGYRQSFLSLSGGEGGYPGFFQLGLACSYAFTDHVQGTLAAGYLTDIDAGGAAGTYDAGIYWRAGAHFLYKRVNLVMLEGRGKVMRDQPLEWPSGSAIFARQLGRMRLGVGAAFGQFEVMPGEPPLLVYPWVDVWWRF